MLDRTKFASWQQRIRLYCRGKENRVNILKSIDVGSFQMGTVREPLAEGAPHLGQEPPQVYSDLSPKEKDRYNADIRVINILLQGLPKDIYTLISHYTDAKDIWDNVKMLLEDQGTNPRGGGAAGNRGVPNRVGNADPGQARQDLALNVDNVFQADDCDAFDFDVDEAPMAQTMFMANLSFVDPVNDEAGPSYDFDILSEYVKDNVVPVVHSNVSSIPTDAYMMEETLKKELHSVKLQLASTLNHNKLMVKEVTSMKKDFKEKENKYLKDFLDMKSLKEKVKYRLFKQDQSLQTVHMLCRPKPYYNELNKVAIGYKNPLCLTREKQVQPALYNGHEIIKDSHVPAIVHNTKDTLGIAEITRRKMNDKMKDPECVTNKVKIAPLDYWKENFLATFTP
nr:integrase, catalytic region, zinc finger, CCHC-type, peptidase aspartic, catalytic [Tanacetum cinerariifolium]